MSAGAAHAVDGIQLAASVSIAGCGDCKCGLIYFRLHDQTGAIFAAASMPVEIAVRVVEQLGIEIRGAGLTGLAALPAEGRA